MFSKEELIILLNTNVVIKPLLPVDLEKYPSGHLFKQCSNCTMYVTARYCACEVCGSHSLLNGIVCIKK